MKFSHENQFRRPFLCSAFFVALTIGASNSIWAADTFLNGSNTFSGTVASGDVLRLRDTSSLSGPVVNNGQIEFGFTQGTLYTNSHVISGSGGVWIAYQAGTVTYTGANTYTGFTNVKSESSLSSAASLLKLSNPTGASIQGNLFIGTAYENWSSSVTATHSNQFGPNSIISFNAGSGSAYFQMHADQVVAGLSGNAGLGGIEVNKFGDTTNHGNQTLTVNVASGTNYSYTGILRNADSAASSTLGLTKTGAGAQNFTGGQILYTGATHVNAGTLSLTGATAINSFVSKTVNIGSGGIFKLDATGAGPADNGATDYVSGIQFGQTATSASPMTLSGAGTFQVTGGAPDVLGLGNTSSSANGAVRISLSSGGLIQVQSGILRNGGYNGASWTNNKGGLQVDSGATFQLWDGGNDVRVDALTGAGTIGNGLINNFPTLVVGVDNGSGTFSGVIKNGLTDAVTGATAALTKEGTGTQTLTGNNTYTGGTTLKGGVLSLGSAGAIGSSGTITFSGGTLQQTAANTTDYSSRFSNAANQQYKIDINGQTGTLASALTSVGGSFLKSGSGTLMLTGTNTYTGETRVSSGMLVVNGMLAASGQVVVENGATIGGSGTVGALTVLFGGIIAPGNSPGILNTGDYTQEGTLSVELNGTIAGTEYDQINVTGAVVLSGDLVATVGYQPVNDQLLFILVNDGTDAGV